MRIDTKIVLAAALTLGAASAALAGDNSSGDYHGGFVMQGSMDGVNSAHHPDWFPNAAKRGKRSSSANWGIAYGSANGGTAYGFANGDKAVGSTNGVFINGDFIPRGTSPAQVPLFHEED